MMASKFRQFLDHFKAPFTKAFWHDLVEETDNEKLVDLALLSYAYLEAGIIESIATCVIFAVSAHWKIAD